MQWYYMTPAEIEISLSCSVCHRKIREHEDFYTPINMTNKQWDQIEEIWQIDPSMLAVCEDCMDGYCGVVWWLPPDEWLTKKWAEYQLEKI